MKDVLRLARNRKNLINKFTYRGKNDLHSSTDSQPTRSLPDEVGEKKKNMENEE